MRLLVDTHIFLWHLDDDARLSTDWSVLLEDEHHEKYFSIASLWEIAIKTSIGKLTVRYPLDRIVPGDFKILPISLPQLLVYQQLPMHHRDPFDRILIAQAQTEGLTLLTHDPNFPLYDVALLK
ncbi:type II toxin-antitoxin system VapC family toxin [Fibrella aquatica]|uniref:type II toxin-antitoxin system VapC family toxin n=1 Tax=Fibrella aquatica TaxID=3242487 RepID=UPI00351F878E